MTWVKLDDHFPEHDKIAGLTDRSFRLHVAALCWCARALSDGVVTKQRLEILRAQVRAANIDANLAELVTAKLWKRKRNGDYVVRDYLDYNPSSSEVRERRLRNAERQAEHRKRADRAKKSRVTNAVTNTGSKSAPSPAPNNPLNPPSGNTKCPECGIVFKTAVRLAEHRFNVHDVEPLRAVS